MDVAPARGERIESGALACVACGRKYDILRGIPRFVPADNYARGFGLQWNRHARTQLDSYTGVPISETRFFAETGWPRSLAGETILEVGCGSGRFTEPCLSTGARVVSLDYSSAVDANYASHGANDRLLVVQGDLYAMPFAPGSFDRLFCFGVLQHTPDVAKSFLSLPPYLKPGGSLAVDVYRKPHGWRRLLNTKYWVRPLTKRVRPEALYALCRTWVTVLWPLARLLARIPRFGRSLNWGLLIADYGTRYPLPGPILKEWAILDTFDMLSPAFDQPQDLDTVREWFGNAGLENWEVAYGYNGIEGRGQRALPSS